MSIIGTFPTTIANGQVEDATVVMSLFAWIQSQTNGNACPATTGSAILKGDGAGATTAAVAGTDDLGVAPGLIFDYAGTSAPSGYLLCDGSAVSRATYANLFNAIGSTWGVGDGSTTFNVPDLRRKVTVGVGGTNTGGLATTVGSVGGLETVTIAAGNLPPHAHGVNINSVTESAYHTHIDSGHSHTGGAPAGGQNIGSASPPSITTFGSTAVSTANLGNQTASHYHNVNGNTDNGPGASTAMTNLQPSAVVTKIIKT